MSSRASRLRKIETPVFRDAEAFALSLQQASREMGEIALEGDAVEVEACYEQLFKLVDDFREGLR